MSLNALANLMTVASLVLGLVALVGFLRWGVAHRDVETGGTRPTVWLVLAGGWFLLAVVGLALRAFSG